MGGSRASNSFFDARCLALHFGQSLMERMSLIDLSMEDGEQVPAVILL